MTDYIENIDIKSVRWRKITPVSERLLAMQPGDAIAITHEGYRPDQCGYGTDVNITRCGLRHKLVFIAKTKRRDVRFKFQHLPDGRLGVGCFEKGE